MFSIENLEKTENKILMNADNQEATFLVSPAHCFLKPIFIYTVEMKYTNPYPAFPLLKQAFFLYQLLYFI